MAGPALGQRLDWTPVKAPRHAPLRGSHVLLRAIDAANDADALFAVSHPPEGDPAIWTYLPDGPYESPDHLRAMLAAVAGSQDPLFFGASHRLVVTGGPVDARITRSRANFECRSTLRNLRKSSCLRTSARLP